jgi:hypothetical protein
MRLEEYRESASLGLCKGDAIPFSPFPSHARPVMPIQRRDLSEGAEMRQVKCARLRRVLNDAFLRRGAGCGRIFLRGRVNERRIGIRRRPWMD